MFKLLKIRHIQHLLHKQFPTYDNVAIYDIIKEVEYALADSATLEEAEEVMWQYLNMRPNRANKFIKEI